jgi:hypothetical protein
MRVGRAGRVVRRRHMVRAVVRVGGRGVVDQPGRVSMLVVSMVGRRRMVEWWL